MSGELWRPVPEFEGLYEVSSHGRIRSLERIDRTNHRWPTRIKSLRPDGDGYPQVSLSRDGIKHTRRVHVLVALAFIGPRPAGMQVCHGDGTKTNNHVENLRYGTNLDNHLDAVAHGTLGPWTHCINGHEFTPENTAFDAKQRRCRECVRVRARKYYWARRREQGTDVA